ncbi:phosphodiester glycosidase family protein [Lacticaseibacillus rhamnosus]|uniref:phosphodiester glycosidase family protein n=1 Tax=Lacticaseibacillus rhamnosus TaxID=47715 RepID=UPI0007DF2E5E|nr:phosphodiester glycosidase family protein [Lacticaseibacillus rhamnosus]OAU17104.1 peptidase [Lacticaseibacillus rhamnosus]OAU21779.1 peptidase [Lacticaseibacillus rhamnosus]
MVRKRWTVAGSLLLMAALMGGEVAAPVVAVTAMDTPVVSSAAATASQKSSSATASSAANSTDAKVQTNTSQEAADTAKKASSTTTASGTTSAITNTQADVTNPVIKSIIGQQQATLAPGITEQKLTYLNQNGVQNKYYSVALDPKNPNTTLLAGMPNDGAKPGMQTVRNQANAAISHGQQVVAAVNADYYNMATGAPLGNVVKNGTEIYSAPDTNEAFFGIKKDGTPVIGTAATYQQIKGDLQQAVGGPSIFVKDGKVNATQVAGSEGNEPCTAVGIKADGTVFFVVIDGRQAPLSTGISVGDFAKLMIERGAVNALFLDGGGSATFVARQPGDTSLTVQNSPSDGNERLVANSWLIVSKATADHKLASATVAPDDQVYTPKSSVKFSAKGVDASGNAAPLPSSGPIWQLKDPSMGTIDSATGVFQSNGKLGDVTAQLSLDGKVLGAATVTIFQPDKLAFSQNELSLRLGAKQDLGLTATYQGRPVNLKSGDIQWSVPSPLGTMTADNQLQTSKTMASGTVKATVTGTNINTQMTVQVGQLPKVLYDFESGLDDWAPSTAGRGEVSNIGLSSATDGEVRFGQHALKLDYDFTNGTKSATLGVYAGPTTSKPIPGMPTGIGMWIYATPEAKGYWLRMFVTDATGTAKPIDLTPQDTGIDWTGWKYVEALIPAGYQGPFTTFPKQMIRMMSLKSGQTDGGPMTKGSLYIDNVRAVYGTNVDDLKAPIISSINVANQTYKNAQVSITTAVHDDTSDPHATGVDWTKARIWVDGTEYTNAKGHYSIDKDGTFTLAGYKWRDGTHHVKVSVQDKFGNETDRETDFKVATGAQNGFSLTGLTKTATLGGTYQLVFKADKSTQAQSLTSTIALPVGFPVKTVDFGENIGSYQYDANTGMLTLKLTKIEQTDLARITVTVPASTTADKALTYALTQGEVTSRSASDVTGTFSTPQAKVGITAAYQLTAPNLIIGQPATLKVTDAQHKAISAATITATNADGKTTGLGTTDHAGQLTTQALTQQVGKFTLQAHKDGYSFPVATQNYTAQKTAAPTNLLAGATQDPEHAKTITWMSSPVAGTGKALLQVATQSAYKDQGAAAFKTATGRANVATYSADSSAVRLNTATATGLKSGTTYVYRVGDGTNWSAPRTFTTLHGGSDYTFNVFGDTQVSDDTGLDDFSTVLSSIEKAKPTSDFAIHVGDFNDDQSVFSEADKTAEMFNQHPAFDSLDMIHVLGNHEYMGDDGSKSAEMLGVPNTNGPAANKLGTYSVDYGNMHIAVIGWTDNEQTMKAERTWLKQDMQATKKTWKIVLTHQPVYNKNPADAQSLMFHDMLAPVCDELGIDLVFNGHDHSYGRTYPLINHKQAKNGTVYIATGHTGDKTYEIQPTQPAVWQVVQKDKDEKVYLTLHVTGDKMSLLVRHPDGSVVDQATFTAHKHKTTSGGSESGSQPSAGSSSSTTSSSHATTSSHVSSSSTASSQPSSKVIEPSQSSVASSSGVSVDSNNQSAAAATNNSRTSASESKKKAQQLPATGENNWATGILGLLLVVASAATYLLSGYRRTR